MNCFPCLLVCLLDCFRFFRVGTDFPAHISIEIFICIFCFDFGGWMGGLKNQGRGQPDPDVGFENSALQSDLHGAL